MTTGERLTTVRQSLHLTQDQVAKRVGCSRVYLSEVERDLRNPSLDWIHDLATAIGCDPHDLDARLTSISARIKEP